MNGADRQGRPADAPLVSVIIPTFNHADYVGQAIESVLQQSYPHVEIIVIDDGSTDGTADILQRFAERIRCIRQSNRGLSAARNAGLQLARGDLIGLLDADDLYGPEYLRTMVALLASHPEAGGAYCGYRSIDVDGRLLPHLENRVMAPQALHTSLLMGNYLGVNAPLVRRDCYLRCGGFDERLQASEDWDMWLRLTASSTWIGTREVLVFRRVLAQSMSTDPARMLASRLQVLATHVGPPEDAALDSVRNRAYARAYLSSCVEHLQAMAPDGAYERLVDLVRVRPETLCEPGTLYELGCGGQWRGSRGDFATMALDDNARWLFDTLARLEADARTRTSFQPIRRQARAQAHLTMALLNYGARRLPQTRRHLREAVRADARLYRERRLWSTLARSLLLQAGLGPR
jgi:glycosyltransferase involved in cell wall biosynthesis